MREIQESNLELAPLYKQRLKIHEEIKRASRKETNHNERGWSRRDGLYDRLFSQDMIFEDQKCCLETKDNLSEVETLMYYYIRFLLERSTKPVVCVDIGGMNGISMLRLATHLRTEIENGGVELIVTNLGFSPTEASIQESIETANNTEPSAILSAFKAGLVQYKKLDVAELVTALTEQGKQIDICHEMDALMHGYVNDADLRMLSSVLSEDALLMLKTITEAHFQANSIDDRQQMAKERFVAHSLGLQVVQQKGYKRVDLGSQSGYSIFTKINSPLQEILQVLRQSR